MESKFLLIIFLLNLGLASTQLSCRYVIDEDGYYICYLTLENSDGLDNFSSISGYHIDGRTDSDVISVHFEVGNSPIIPQIICQQFPEIVYIIIREDNFGLQRLTELSFASCVNLFWVEIRNNYITEVTPGTLINNVDLYGFVLIGSRITTLPEDLFANTPNIEYLDVSLAPTLTDLPVNIFKDLENLQTLYLDNNRLNIWRPEWTQNLPKLVMLGLNQNYLIPEIPRNAVNSKDLLFLWIDTNLIRSIDYFMFNNISVADDIHLHDQPIDAIDFNFIDGLKAVQHFNLENLNCVNENFFEFTANREEFIELIEPCFVAFDKKILCE